MNLMPIRIGILKAATALYQLTGASLLKYSGARPIPIEQSFGGEVGIFYFVPFIATYYSISAIDATWWFLLMQILLGVIVSGSAFFYHAKTFVGKVCVVIGVSLLGIVAWIVSDVYVTYFFTVSFFPWLLVLLERKYYKVLLPYVFLLGLIIEYGNFVRSFSGLPLLVGSLFAIVFLLRSFRKILLSILFITMAMGLVKLHIHRTIQQRNIYLKSQSYIFEKEKLEHIFWHNIYMGFGFITNNKDIDFSDSCSMNKVKSVDPKVVYSKPEYENTLRNEVLKLCLYSPNFVLRVIFAKLGVLFYYFLLFANIGLIAAYYYPKDRYIELSYFVTLLVSALPGLLTVPVIVYLLGFCSIAALYGIHSLINASNKLRKI